MGSIGFWLAFTGICASVFLIFICIRHLFYLVFKSIDDNKKMNEAIDKVMRNYCVDKMNNISDEGDE